MTLYLQDAWERIWSAFFHPATSLFYDCLTENGLHSLPTPQEIAKQYPNPCGWSTGMEDSMLSAGAAMDILRFRHAVFRADDRIRIQFFSVKMLETGEADIGILFFLRFIAKRI